MPEPGLTDFDRRLLDYAETHGDLRFLLRKGLPWAGTVSFVAFSVIDYATRYGLIAIEPFPQAVFTHCVRWIPGSILVGVVGPLAFLMVARARRAKGG